MRRLHRPARTGTSQWAGGGSGGQERINQQRRTRARAAPLTRVSRRPRASSTCDGGGDGSCLPITRTATNDMTNCILLHRLQRQQCRGGKGASAAHLSTTSTPPLFGVILADGVCTASSRASYCGIFFVISFTEFVSPTTCSRHCDTCCANAFTSSRLSTRDSTHVMRTSLFKPSMRPLIMP